MNILLLKKTLNISFNLPYIINPRLNFNTSINLKLCLSWFSIKINIPSGSFFSLLMWTEFLSEQETVVQCSWNFQLLGCLRILSSINAFKILFALIDSIVVELYLLHGYIRVYSTDQVQHKSLLLSIVTGVLIKGLHPAITEVASAGRVSGQLVYYWP